MDTEMTIDDANHAMNLSCARTLGNLIRMLAEGEKVDFNDMARVLGGRGRLFFGHVDIESSEAPTEEQLSREVESCMSSPYVKFDGQFGPGIVTVNAAQTWSKRTAGQIRNLISAEIERRDKQRHFKQNVGGEFESQYDPAPVDPYVVPSGWGFTVLIAEHDPNHEPLDLDITVEAADEPAAIEVTAPPQGGNRALPPSGGRAVSHPTPEGATTASPHPATHAPNGAQPATVHRSTLRFSEFMDNLRRNDPAAAALASGEPDLNQVSLPTSGVKSVVNEERFAKLLGDKFSPSWRTLLLDRYVEESRPVLRDGEVRLGVFKKTTLKTIDPAQLSEAQEKMVGENDKAGLKVLQNVCRLWGPEAVSSVQARIASSSEPSVAAAVPATAHSAAAH
jgi:hypothetical protein